MMLTLLSKTLGKSNEEISAILYKKADDGTQTDEISETALETLESLHAEHLAAAPADLLKAEFNKGHNAGKFEALNKKEEYIRKTYGVTGTKFDDLISEVAKKAANPEGLEDKILTHPLYVSKIAEKDEEIARVTAESEAKVTEATQKAERQMRFNTVLPTLDSALAAAGVDTANMKPAVKRAFLSLFEGKDFEILETGTFVKNADGTLQKDKHGHPIKLEAFVSQEAPNWFPIEKQPGRQTPGNEGGEPAKPTKWTKENVPKDMKGFEAVYGTLSGSEANEFVAAFEAANNPNAPTVAAAT